MSKTFINVTNTWAVAQLIHPALLMIYFGTVEKELDGMILVAGLIFGFFFSLPAYLLCLAFFNPVIECTLTKEARLWIWIFTTISCIVLGFLIITTLLFDIEMFIEVVRFVIPGCISAIIAIVIRHHQFMRFIHQ